MPRFRGQSGASSVVRHGLQLGQFLEASGTAQVGEAVVSLHAQGQVHQDRSQGGQPFALCDISNGRSGCSEGTLSGNP